MKIRMASQGFTLIELMIAVVIVGVLAAIAYPSYTTYVAQTRRTDAQIGLTRTAAQLEKFFTNCSRYPTAAEYAATPANLDCAAARFAGSATSPDGYYTLVYAQGAAGCGGAGQPPANNCFVLTATPTTLGAQLARDGAKCTTFTLNHRGTKAATGSESTKCWKK